MESGWNLQSSYSRLPGVFYTRLEPTPVAAPRLVLFNDALAEELGLVPHELKNEEGAAVFAGNALPPGAEPLAQAYAGHQFGHFTMLGDGRAILLGEQVTPDGRRADIQLKGAGRTPYSRGGDGRAALGPMLREYIISEAMHGLGIPTTRGLAVTATGEEIARETMLPGAILTRVASSHLRVGTFQFAAARGDGDHLRALADYAMARHYPDIDREDPDRYALFLAAVMEKQARLVARWQLAGFIHGVMNTDNMSIAGETIDYGPCAFMDAYDPGTVFSSIDRGGRYAYGNQPRIAGWNLARFAEALLSLLNGEQEKAVAEAQEILSEFFDRYREIWRSGMGAKLGLHREEPGDISLMQGLLSIMRDSGADYTNTFRALTLGRPEEAPAAGAPRWDEWVSRWERRLENQEGGRRRAREIMQTVNPAVIPRNHRVEEALAAAVEEGDMGPAEKLLAVLEDPFAYSPEQEEFAAPPPEREVPYVTYCGT